MIRYKKKIIKNNEINIGKILFSLCLGPRLDTCISSVICIGVLLHPADVLCLSRWFLLCGTRCQSHYIWMVCHDGCPSAGIGWCVLKMRNQTTLSRKKKKNRNINNNQEHKSYITVPYHQGLSESFKRICRKYCIEVHLKGGHTIKNLLMNPKDRDPILKRSGVIYSFRCNKVECDEEYIGESARTFGERYKEHQKSPSPIHDHFTISGHTVSVEDFSILAREDQNLLRTIKEAIYIRANNPSLDKNVGKFHLPHIWDEVLVEHLRTKIEIADQ